MYCVSTGDLDGAADVHVYGYQGVMLQSTPRGRSIAGSVLGACRARLRFQFRWGWGRGSQILERGEDGLGAADGDLRGVGLDLRHVLAQTEMERKREGRTPT